MEELVMLRNGPKPSGAAGVAVLQKGFRPFFLLASLWAVLVVPLWLLILAGRIGLGGYLASTYWHAHEMVFGYATAVVAGFLLTAAGNWTKRDTAVGLPLLGLVVLWIAGRVVMLASAALPPLWVATVSLSFIPGLAVALGRSIIAARSRRNYGFLVVLSALFTAQLAVHLGALGVWPGAQRTGVVVGVDLMILLIVIMGGRVIPMFTQSTTSVITHSYRWLDRGAIASTVLFTVVDAVGVEVPRGFVTVVAAVAGCFTAGRAIHWGTLHTRRHPLLWVLHVGYLWVPIGLGLRALSSTIPAVGSSLATHVLTVGAIGTMTLGMMVRVGLGHTGRPLETPRIMVGAFVLITLTTLLRVVAALVPASQILFWLSASGALWTAAFLAYVVHMSPILLRARIDGKFG